MSALPDRLRQLAALLRARAMEGHRACLSPPAGLVAAAALDAEAAAVEARARGAVGIVSGGPDYSVDTWDADERRIIDHLARTTSQHIARAAFEEAVRRWPQARIMMRHGAMVRARWPAK